MNEIIQVLQEPLPRVSIDALSTSDKPRVLVMGGGGIAPGVVTATVTIVQRLLERGFHPVGLLGSWEGVQREGEMGVCDFTQIESSVLQKLTTEGGTCLGPGRGMLTRDQFSLMYGLRQKIGFLGTAVVGGDGTLSGSQALQYSLDKSGQPISNTVACIKTIDGDAEGSLAIGFQSSAFVYAQSVQAMMREIPWEDGIGIVGVYGRDNGHLTLRAAALAAPDGAPIVTLVPEFPVTREHFLNRVRELKQQHKHVCIVASEGFSFSGEGQIIDSKKTDGAGNPKLLGCIEILEQIIRADEGIKALGKYSLRTSEPGIMTRSCNPIEADIRLAKNAGTAVVDIIEREGWGHAVAMQGTFAEGFRPVVTPLWKVSTGNPVTDDLYDTGTLSPRPYFREYVAEQSPHFHEGDYSVLPAQKEAHRRLLKLIADGPGVEHNGVFVPSWAIQEEPDGREKPTKWTAPILRLLTTK